MEKILDRYGPLKMPEEKRRIEIKENTVKTILSLYEVYVTTAQKMLEGNYIDDLAEHLYSEAERLFENMPDFNPPEEAMEEAMKEIRKKAKKAKSEGVAGLYLSALLNCTSIERMLIKGFGDCILGYIGYRLGENKTLEIGEGMQANYVGDYCRGNIINRGDVDAMAYEAKRGCAD